jgi:hypothetical protein
VTRRRRLSGSRIYEEGRRGPLIRYWKFDIRQDRYPDRVWWAAKQKSRCFFRSSGFLSNLVANQGLAVNAPKALFRLIFRLLHTLKIADEGSSSSAKIQHCDERRSALLNLVIVFPVLPYPRPTAASDGTCMCLALRDLIAAALLLVVCAGSTTLGEEASRFVILHLVCSHVRLGAGTSLSLRLGAGASHVSSGPVCIRLRPFPA